MNFKMNFSSTFNRVRLIVSVAHASFGLLSKRDLKRIVLLVLANISVSSADLFGLLLIGLISSQAISLVSMGTIKLPESLSSLSFLKDSSGEQAIVIIGILVALLLASKTMISALITRRTIGFLAYREAEISSKYFELYLSSSLESQKKLTPQVIAGRAFACVNSCITQMVGNSTKLITEFFYLLILLCGVAIIDWTIALPAILFYASVALVSTRHLGKDIKTSGQQIYSFGVSGAELIQFSGLTFREIKVSNQEAHIHKTFENNRMSSYKAIKRQSFLSVIPKYLAEITLIIGAFTMTGIQLLIKDFQSTIAALAIFSAMSLRMIPAVLRIQVGILEMIAAIEPSREFLQSFKEMSTYKKSASLDELKVSKNIEKPQIYLKSVTVKFEDSAFGVIDDLSLEINEGEFVAITGPSGAGKTTLIDTILGLQGVESGIVEIEGVNPTVFIKNNKNAIRYVPQNVQLIPTSLRNNLLWPGAFDANLDKHLVNCLKLAELESFLESLPKGLDTVISPNGANLSGGQRQRIGIARSLVANPRILFLDEATSSLDAKTEAEISHKIFSKLVNVTRVVIAHRISTIQSADRIIYLDEGKIVGKGSFSELINQVPAFRVAANASLEK